jgi:hypothetical protein
VEQAEVRLEALNTYQVKITRTERIGDRLQPEEEILLSVRRDPKAVRLEWISGPNKGREVIYSTALDQRMLFVHTPSSVIPIPTMRIPVDSPLVTRNSRHSITEAGFDSVVNSLRPAVREDPPAQRDQNPYVYQGLQVPPGLDQRSHKFTRRSPSGETWSVYLDRRTKLPCMAVGVDAHGSLLERDIYQGMRENPADLASADAFDPDRRWGDAKSILSRFTRIPTGSAASSSAHPALP